MASGSAMLCAGEPNQPGRRREAADVTLLRCLGLRIQIEFLTFF